VLVAQAFSLCAVRSPPRPRPQNIEHRPQRRFSLRPFVYSAPPRYLFLVSFRRLFTLPLSPRAPPAPAHKYFPKNCPSRLAMRILFLTIRSARLLLRTELFFSLMNAISEHEPAPSGPRRAFPVALAFSVRVTLAFHPLSRGARRTFVLAQAVGWIGFAPG
jgi:hypothetical protein